MIHDGVLILNPDMADIDPTARIDSMTKLECGLGLHIGKGCHISSFCHIGIGGGKLWVGDYVAITSGVKIHTGSNTPAGQSMSSASPASMQEVHRGEVTIGDFAFIGSGAQILMGVTVGEYAIVGAGAVVTKDVPAWTVWMGVPAKMVGRRVQMPDGAFGIEYFAKAEAMADLMEAMYP